MLVFFMIPIMHVSYGVAQWVEIMRPGCDLSESRTSAGQAKA
jgi:hypothetical protein